MIHLEVSVILTHLSAVHLASCAVTISAEKPTLSSPTGSHTKALHDNNKNAYC